MSALNKLERRIVQLTQAGLPLTPRPYAVIAQQLNITEAEVCDCLTHMLERGFIRRIGAVPNHYALGYVANGMSVWDIDDAAIDEVGERIGKLDFISHCYRRPRRRPQWPYNLFAMVHARNRETVHQLVAEVAALLEQEFPNTHQQHDILFSSEILKKTGLRIQGHS